jgi:hypothetical protein
MYNQLKLDNGLEELASSRHSVVNRSKLLDILLQQGMILGNQILMEEIVRFL